jgi:CBS domain-containing protein
MQIGQFMSRSVELVSPDSTLKEAAAAMARLDFGALPVGDGDRLVGMVTDRDIAVRGIAAGHGPDASIREVMTPNVKYCFEDEDAAHVAENMAALQVRRLPVMNRNKRLVGIVALADLAYSGAFSETAQALRGISQPARDG